MAKSSTLKTPRVITDGHSVTVADIKEVLEFNKNILDKLNSAFEKSALNQKDK